MNDTEIEQTLPFSFGLNQHCNNIWLTLTNLCNIHCKYCFNYVLRDNEHMPANTSLQILKGTLESFDNTKIPLKINYFGGEPTINQKALLDCINYIDTNNINAEQSLMTNGIIGEQLLEKLLKKHISFQVSYDGSLNNLRMNKSMTKPLEVQTVSTIEKLVNAEERVSIRGTFHHANVKNLVGLVVFCHEKGVKNLRIAPVCDFGDSKRFGIKSPEVEEYVDQFAEGLALAARYGVNLNTTGSFLSHWKKNKIVIPFVWLPDGKASMTITNATSRGEGFAETQIAELDPQTKTINIDSERIKEMKRNFVRNRDKYCNECPIREICAGNIHFTPFSTNTFVPERDRYSCLLVQELHKRNLVNLDAGISIK